MRNVFPRSRRLQLLRAVRGGKEFRQHGPTHATVQATQQTFTDDPDRSGKDGRATTQSWPCSMIRKAEGQCQSRHTGGSTEAGGLPHGRRPWAAEFSGRAEATTYFSGNLRIYLQEMRLFSERCDLIFRSPRKLSWLERRSAMPNGDGGVYPVCGTKRQNRNRRRGSGSCAVLTRVGDLAA